MTIDLSPELEKLVQEQAAKSGFDTVDSFVAHVLEQALGTNGSDEPKETRPIWKVITERMSRLPPEAFEGLPTDGASEVDHYVYGLPKRNR